MDLHGDALVRNGGGPPLPYVPTKKLRNEIISALHNDPLAGHLSVDITVRRIEDRFYWESIREDVVEYIKKCNFCGRNKPAKKNKVAFKPIRVCKAWSDVH